MHMVISVVVEAHDISSAVENAESWFIKHLHYGNGGPFDYCKPMTTESEVAGSSRWTDYQGKPLAYPLASEDGQDEVEDAWKHTKTSLEKNVESMFDAMEDCTSKEDFVEKLLKDEGLLRHHIKHIGAYQDTTHYLYMQGWSSGGIRSKRGWNHIQECIEDDSADSDDARMWVVPLDVHC